MCRKAYHLGTCTSGVALLFVTRHQAGSTGGFPTWYNPDVVTVL